MRLDPALSRAVHRAPTLRLERLSADLARHLDLARPLAGQLPDRPEDLGRLGADSQRVDEVPCERRELGARLVEQPHRRAVQPLPLALLRLAVLQVLGDAKLEALVSLLDLHR